MWLLQKINFSNLPHNGDIAKHVQLRVGDAPYDVKQRHGQSDGVPNLKLQLPIAFEEALAYVGERRGEASAQCSECDREDHVRQLRSRKVIMIH